MTAPTIQPRQGRTVRRCQVSGFFPDREPLERRGVDAGDAVYDTGVFAGTPGTPTERGRNPSRPDRILLLVTGGHDHELLEAWLANEPDYEVVASDHRKPGVRDVAESSPRRAPTGPTSSTGRRTSIRRP